MGTKTTTIWVAGLLSVAGAVRAGTYSDKVAELNAAVYYQLDQGPGAADGSAVTNSGTLGADYDGTWGSGLSDYPGREAISGEPPADTVDDRPVVGLDAGGHSAQFAPEASYSDMISINVGGGGGPPVALDTESQTYAFFFKTSQTNGWSRLMTTDAEGNNRFEIAFINSTRQLVLINGNANSMAYASAKSYSDGKWHHLVAIRDSGEQGDMRLFIDGRQESLIDYGGNWTAGYQARFGALGTSDYQAYEGYIDEIAIWNRALTPAEAVALFDAAVPPLPAVPPGPIEIPDGSFEDSAGEFTDYAYVSSLHHSNHSAWDAVGYAWVGNHTNLVADYEPTNYPSAGAHDGNQYVRVNGGNIFQALDCHYVAGSEYTLTVWAVALTTNLYVDCMFTDADASPSGYGGVSNEFTVSGYLGHLAPAETNTWVSKTYTYTATAADDGKRIGIQFMDSGYSAGRIYIDDVSLSRTAPSPTEIVSLKPLGGNVFEMVFDCTLPESSCPLERTDLIYDSWACVAHAADIDGPFAVTNLGYSGTLDGHRVIYLESTNSTAFFGIGEQ